MTVVIMAVGFANGQYCSHEGQWVQSFDHDAYNGRGFGMFTNEIEKAIQFKDLEEAMTFWKKQSSINPIREDGKPNRPMTALTVTIERID